LPASLPVRRAAYLALTAVLLIILGATTLPRARSGIARAGAVAAAVVTVAIATVTLFAPD
jgi:hypothetical protein